MAACLCACLVGTAWGQPPAAADGDAATRVTLPANTSVPLSAYASPQARELFAKLLDEHARDPSGTTIAEKRAYYDRMNSDRAERMRKLYPVRTSTQTIAGVGADVVEPAQGVAAKNARRVLINLHGGAFLWGAHSGALVEAIPVASLGRIKVIGVDYRQGPEHRFPAASDDVEAVYRELLKTYSAKNIGIYGCSAGGYLTGEVTARLLKDKLPLPGAIGTFCGSLVAPDGDSLYTAAALGGERVVPTHAPALTDYPYFAQASASDPLVLPGNSMEMLARFPPTLLITGTRDFNMSSVIRSHALLVQAGAEAELHVWDGMWHSFFSDPEMPESKQAYDVIVRFFDRHLGASR
jgi:acetyl esterase/lipase